MNPRLFGLVIFIAVGVTGVLLWGASIPLGVPGEWTWPRLPATVESLVGAGSAMFVGVLYIAFVLWGRHTIVDRSRLTAGGLVTALVAAGFVWLWTVQQSVPAPANLGKGPFVLFYPRSSGYFWQARHDVTSTAEFLAGYEELLAERDYLHIGTHPPGLTLGYRGLLALCASSPGLCELVLASSPASVRESLTTIEALASGSGRAVTRADQAVLWLAMVITLLAAAATSAGIYMMTRRQFDRSAAWTTAAIWPLVPAIAVFHPKSDTLYPFVAVAAAGLWLTACDRRSYVRAVLAGAMLWLGMMLSLAFATIGLLMALMTAWEWWGPKGQTDGDSLHHPGSGRQQLLLLLAGAAGFLVPSACIDLVYDINFLNVWRWNIANHALFYEHNVRTWWKWLLVNPLELALAVGLPIIAVGCLSLWRMMKDRSLFSLRGSVPLGFLVVWGLLWLSGKNMGEAARLWILLMPWTVMSAAAAFCSKVTRSDAAGTGSRPMATWTVGMILAAQMIVCILTVQRIDGFHFTELVPMEVATSNQ